MSVGGPAVYLSPAQIAGVADAAGFPPSALPTAVAIAMAESGGNINALDNTSNPSAPGYHAPGAGDSPEFSEGLFQINVLANPEFANENLANPITDAQAAEQLYQSDGFSPWSTYTEGAYTKYLTQATQAAAAPQTVTAAQAASMAGQSTPSGTAAAGSTSATDTSFLGDIASATGLDSIADDLLDGLATITFVLAGLGMVVVGVAMLGNPQARKAAQQLPAVTPEVITAGAAA